MQNHQVELERQKSKLQVFTVQNERLILQLYKETVELALRENVVANQGGTPTSTSKVKQG